MTGSEPAPLVTILLATFDGVSHLDAQLTSLLEQDEPSWRLLAVDDGSTDSTRTSLERWSRTDDRITVLPPDGQRLGPTRRYLQLLSMVTTPWWAFCDQDDVWTDDHLSALLQTARRITADPDAPVAVCSDAVVTDAELRVERGSALAARGVSIGAGPWARITPERIALHNLAFGFTMLGNRAVAQLAARGADDDRVAMHDWWVALLASSRGHLVCLPRVTAQYRQHDRNVAGLPSSARARLRRSLGDGLRARTDRIVGRAALQAAAVAELLGDAPPALQRLAQLAGHRPTPRRLMELQRTGIRLPGRLHQVALIVGAAMPGRAGAGTRGGPRKPSPPGTGSDELGLGAG